MLLPTRPFLQTRDLDGLLAAAAGFAIIFAFTRHGGIGVSPDSITYISVAAHIHDHGAWTDFHGDPLIDFPALYPLFLSAVQGLTGMGPMRFGPVLNALLFAVLIYLSGWLMERSSFGTKNVFWSGSYKWILLLFIVFSPCLLEVYSMIWSETLFIPLVMLFFFFCRRYFLSHAAGAVVILGLVAGLACFTRYAGISLVGTAGVLLLCDPGLRPRRKAGHLFLFGISAFVFPAFNLYHNMLAGSSMIGNREKGIVSLGRNLHDFGSVFCDWLHIPGDHEVLASLIGSGWILLFIGAFALRLARKRHVYSYEQFVTAWFIVYAVFLLGASTVSRFQQLDSRLLSPLFIPWLWGTGDMVRGWITSRSIHARKAILFPVGIAVACCLLGQGLADRETWEGVKDAGIPGYTEDDWRQSETMDFVRKNKDRLLSSRGLYSNANDALWFLGNIHADLLPHKDLPVEINAFLAKDSLYVVRFDDGVNTDLVDIPFISRHKTAAAVYPFSDGTVYFFITDSLQAKPK